MSAPKCRASAPPRGERGLVAWLQKNLFASVGDGILTVVGLLLIAVILPPFIRWAFLEAAWTGRPFGLRHRRRRAASSRTAGPAPAGPFVKAKFALFMFGRYPIDERWRVMLVGVMFVALLVPLLMPRVPRKG
jgi:general L-amino acid transport system permease protein